MAESFSIDVPAEQSEKEKRLASVLDKGLDDIAKEEKENRRRQRESERQKSAQNKPVRDLREEIRREHSRDRRSSRDDRRDRRSSSRIEDRRSGNREKVLDCRISRYDLEQLARRHGIETRGYNLHLEAVLTPRSRR